MTQIMTGILSNIYSSGELLFLNSEIAGTVVLLSDRVGKICRDR